MRPERERRQGNVPLVAALVVLAAGAAILVWFVNSTGGISAL
ncbi:hypothetical protein [Frigoribacterium sp. MEB024]|nr:hypothetical protein [Frigoribacterium sp. MEB024]